MSKKTSRGNSSVTHYHNGIEYDYEEAFETESEAEDKSSDLKSDGYSTLITHNFKEELPWKVWSHKPLNW